MEYNIYYDDSFVRKLFEINDVIEYLHVNDLKIVDEFYEPGEEYISIFTEDKR